MPDARFEEALRALYYEWGALGYWANRFYQKFSSHCKRYIGGPEAVRSVLPHETAGFRFLKERHRLDLSVEALILQRQWRELFDDEERATATRKLGRHRK